MNIAHREFCYRCFKPKVICLCERIPKVENRTNVLILQHPAERAHPIGTVRIAELGLKKVQVKIAYPNQEERLVAQFDDLHNAGLLYPSPHAKNLTDLTPGERPKSLIVLDGTWANAHCLYKENRWLQQLPHYSLTPSAPSNYRIRLEPSDNYISTIEAIVAALKLLEPENNQVDQLLTAFDAMIDDQLHYIREKKGVLRRKKPKKKIKRSIPPAISERFNNVVIVYGETFPISDRKRILLSWTALRIGDGATFECFLKQKPDFAFDDYFMSEMKLTPNHFRNAFCPETFSKRWNDFLKEGDVICAWNKGTLLSFFDALNRQPKEFIFLKAAYGNTIKVKCGTLDDVVKREKLSLTPTPFAGRAATRMSNAVAVAKHLNQNCR